MKLVKPNAELIPQEVGLEGIYKQIERCGRVCYKSEDKITDSSSKDFVERMIKSNHTAMLEHGTVYLFYKVCVYSQDDFNFVQKYQDNPYSKVIYIGTDDNEQAPDGKFYDEIGDSATGDMQYCITTNYRVLVENEWLDDLQFLCEPTKYHAHRYTVRLTLDRINSQSVTRHRKCSFAQESQRVCDYLAEKFGMSVTYVEPCWIKEEDLEEFKADLEANEKLYFKWRNKGYPAEMARYFLINGAKTEIIVTAFMADWYHFFNLRVRGTTGRPHPDMKRVASLAFNQFVDNGIIDFVPPEDSK